MKPIILLTGPLCSAVSGISTHLNQLFSSNLSQNYKLLQFVVGSEGRYETSVQRLIRFFKSPLDLLLYILKNRPNIIHINTSIELKSFLRDFVYLVVSKLLGCRIVCQVHGGTLPQEFFSRNLFLSNIFRRMLSMTDVIVLLAQLEKKAYQDFMPNIRTVVIPNAIETKNLTDKKNIQLTEGPLRLVFIGRLTREKGIFEIVTAIYILKTMGIEFSLYFAGSGPDESSLHRAVEQKGLSQKVAFLGPLFGEKKNRLWCESDVFVFPTHHEGLPYAILESMAAGVVPVTSPVGAIPEVMQHGIHGLFVPPKDPNALAYSVLRLHRDRTELARMAGAGRKRILENFTVERMAMDFQDLYESL